ncbi:potassium voltage-gated channel subfamily KQT member 4 isoform X1 [Hydra vulgaris]|uniref:potassium voltage-gated channel subfamily KQT member 4 isoform X1 n=1 Tax=Hydra vulgaris TaxID=6087 RepID=UPI001F5F94DF|nr:potassium voltage-gated channel subfamily KQT member 4 isoform X1 [Hydra vulgaris]
MNARKLKLIRLMLYSFLEKRNSKLSYRYHYAIAFLIISCLAAACVTSMFQSDLLEKSQLFLEIFLLAIFILEFALRVFGSGATGTYGSNGGLKKYLQRPHMIIDITVIVSSLLVVVLLHINISMQVKRRAYLLQMFKVVRLDRHRGAFASFILVFKKHRNELLTCWYMGFLVVLLLSFLGFAIETKHDNVNDHLFNSFYWGVISLTTIGYGDIVPEKPAAKILICFFALFGALFLALPAGIIGSGFALQVSEQQKEKHVSRRRRPAAELLQSYWRKYAADNDIECTWQPYLQGMEKNYEIMKKKYEEKFSAFKEEKFSLLDDHVEKIHTFWFPRKSLTVAEKNAIRFIRYLKWVTASRKFKQARRPYDERDILASFSSSQVEILAKLKEINKEIQSQAKENELQFMKILNLEKEVKKTNKLLRQLFEEDQDISDDIYNLQRNESLINYRMKYKSSVDRDFYFSQISEGNLLQKENPRKDSIKNEVNFLSSIKQKKCSYEERDENELHEIYVRSLRTMLRNFQLETIETKSIKNN